MHRPDVVSLGVPQFQCVVCAETFEVSQAVVDKYPGWRPNYCQDHSPKKSAKASRTTPSSASGVASRGKSLREENLTVAQVLTKYSSGPDTGVFTDGSAVPNPGPGGWGVVWVEGGEIQDQQHGHDPDTTNNRMELQALIAAFTMLPKDAAAVVLTDSRLCVDTITKWAPAWERRGWKRKAGPIKNLELVQQLLAAYRMHPTCELRWVAAHAGNRWNEYADSLAIAWMRTEL